MDAEPTTWHFGLMARWWVEFTIAEDDELAFFGACAADGAGRVLDLGCGTGRLLIPLLRQGFDIDGCDLSADMIEQCRTAAGVEGLSPRLFIQAMHHLDLPDLYRTIYICGSFGIGGSRQHDREALRRCCDHLEAGGRLVFNQFQPYSNAKAWSYWVAENRRALPRPWPEEGTRRRAADGDELELRTRLFAFEPLEQRLTLESRVTLWRDGERVAEEEKPLRETLYLRNELLLMLEMAGFSKTDVFGGYTRSPASDDDPMLVYVATK